MTRRLRTLITVGGTLVVVFTLSWAYRSAGWRVVSSSPDSREPFFIHLTLVDDNDGWGVIGPGLLVDTRDGGANWYERGLCEEAEASVVTLIDRYQGWVGGSRASPPQSVVYHTDNGGLTWSPQDLDVGECVTALEPCGPNHLWAVGDQGIARTQDSGQVWYPVYRGTPAELKPGGSCIGVKGFMAFCQDGQILITHDEGRTWARRRISEGFHAVAARFVGENGVLIGWHEAVSMPTQSDAQVGHGREERNALYVSSDGGKAWEERSIPCTTSLFSVGASARNWWVVGAQGVILRGTRDGSRWVRVSSPTSKDLTCVYFGSGDQGWIGGDNMTVLHLGGAISDAARFWERAFEFQ